MTPLTVAAQLRDRAGRVVHSVRGPVGRAVGRELIPYAFLGGLASTVLRRSWIGLLITGGTAAPTRDAVKAAISVKRVADGAGLPARVVPPAGRVRLGRRRIIRNVDYVGNGEYRQHLNVHLPRRSDTSVSPCLVYVHGGSWMGGDNRGQALWMIDRLARSGWVVVVPRYRLSPTHAAPVHLDDVEAAIAWTRANASDLSIDIKRLSIAGGSAGAHLAGLAALDERNAIRSAVLFYGIFDITNSAGNDGPGLVKFMERMVMQTPLASDLEGWRDYSPLFRIDENTPPVLVVHGDADVLTPVAESERFAQAVSADGGGPSYFVPVPGAGHAYDAVPGLRTLATTRAVQRFLARYG